MPANDWTRDAAGTWRKEIHAVLQLSEPALMNLMRLAAEAGVDVPDYLAGALRHLYETVPAPKPAPPACRACNGPLVAIPTATPGTQLARCQSCEGLHGRFQRRRDALQWVNLDRMTERADRTLYFDLEYPDGAERRRTHGWYNPDSLEVVQFG